jgi:hypothetical protein
MILCGALHAGRYYLINTPRGSGLIIRVVGIMMVGWCRLTPGAYTRPVFSSTLAASDKKHTLSTP